MSRCKGCGKPDIEGFCTLCTKVFINKEPAQLREYSAALCPECLGGYMGRRELWYCSYCEKDYVEGLLPYRIRTPELKR